MKINYTVLALSLMLIGCGAPSEKKNTVTSPNPIKKETKNVTSKPKAESKPKSSVKSTGLKDFNGETLAFYNVENLFDIVNDPKVKDEDFLPNSELHWTKDRYDKKLNNIAQVADKLQGDLPIFMGMVEVENRTVLEDLISKNTS